jgi:hypothetical protein
MQKYDLHHGATLFGSVAQISSIILPIDDKNGVCGSQ